MADIIFSDIKSGAGNVGVFPLLLPDQALENFIAQRPDGFLRNGDLFNLPTAPTGSVQYVDNTGSVVWTYTQTAINASVTAYVSFMMDYTNGLLWVAAVDDTAERIYLANINAAGTITNVGNAVAAFNFTTAANCWSGSTAVPSFPSLTRADQGTGNFTLRLANAEIVLDYTNGAIVSETNITGLLAGAYRNLAGHFVAIRSRLESATVNQDTGVCPLNLFYQYNATVVRNGGTIYAPVEVVLPTRFNGAGVDVIGWLQWGDDRIAWTNGIEFTGIYTTDTLERWTNALLAKFKIGV